MLRTEAPAGRAELGPAVRGAGRDLVIRALRDPRCVLAFDATHWDLLLRQAGRANLVPRLAWLIDAHGLGASVPEGPSAHFDGARRLVRVKHAEVRREVTQVLAALEPLGVPVVLLKGAAYVLAGLPAAHGRLFSDIDLMVPKARIDEVESALMVKGWATTHHAEYDQRYYRQWMHELPPLVHLKRQTSLDVHHAIVPETGRWRTDSAKLFERATEPEPGSGWRILAPVDMVLHSMVHLLLNEELDHGLRDLSDIDMLLRHFGAAKSFWAELTARASELGLRRALFHGLGCVADVLGTPVPASVVETTAKWGPAGLPAGFMRAAYRRALRAHHPSTADGWTAAALFGLYLRAHWLRMPPLLLTRHLLVKALRLNKTPESLENPPGQP